METTLLHLPLWRARSLKPLGNNPRGIRPVGELMALFQPPPHLVANLFSALKGSQGKGNRTAEIWGLSRFEEAKMLFKIECELDALHCGGL